MCVINYIQEGDTRKMAMIKNKQKQQLSNLKISCAF